MQKPPQNAEPHTALKMGGQVLGKGEEAGPDYGRSQTGTWPLLLPLHAVGRARPIFPAFSLVILSLASGACRGQFTDPGPTATTFYNLAHAIFPVSSPPPPCSPPPPSRAGLPTHCLLSQRPVPPPHLCSRQPLSVEWLHSSSGHLIPPHS